MRAKRVVVVGAGVNGLAAAAVLARAGCRVEVLEALDWVGGACATAEVTLPGFRHDLGSSAYPMGAASPVFRELGLERFGLRWVHAEVPLAHVMDGGVGSDYRGLSTALRSGRDDGGVGDGRDDGRVRNGRDDGRVRGSRDEWRSGDGGAGEAVLLHRSVEETAEGLGREDGAAYTRLMRPLVEGWQELVPELLGPVMHVPRHPLLLGGFGLRAVQPAATLARELFRGERARALLAGMAGHSVLPLDYPASAAIGLVLGAAAHAVGWPVARGGGQAISDALLACVREAGGEVRTGVRVQSLREVGEADAVLCDLSVEGLLRLAGDELTPSFRTVLEHYKRGPGIFKIDWALDGGIPWADEGARRAGTVHVGGTMAEVARSERAMWDAGKSFWPERPFLIVVQPSVADGTRAPEGKGTAWGYCHVPNGWTGDATEVIEGQIERFAPGFRDAVLQRRTWSTAALEAWDANLLGGDVSGGAMTPWQIAMRPTPRLYGTSRAGLFLCSSATPPGGGVHGMCGWHAARAALQHLRRG